MSKAVLAVNWVALIELVMKILSAILDKGQAEEVRKSLVKEAVNAGGEPDEDNAAASRDLLERAYNSTKRVRAYRRALLRWAMDEVPAVANNANPKLPKASVSEGKKLAAAGD